jgi:hypothetical protein
MFGLKFGLYLVIPECPVERMKIARRSLDDPSQL